MARQFGTRITLEKMDQRLQEVPGAPGQQQRLKSRLRLRAIPVAPPVLAWDSEDSDARLIRDWLSQLQMLKGVPFNYLVADMAMLPGESLRFFQVDKGWLAALLDGAFSIGNGAVDSLTAEQACKALRAAAERTVQNCEMRQAQHAEVVSAAQCRPVTAGTRLSGFLLRSTLLGAWPGLEVQGFAGDTTLSIVRMELLAPGLLLCLFNDQLTRVRFTLPAEASHFGVRDAGRQGFDKALRRVGDDPGELTGQTVAVSLRNNGRRVIALQSLAASMGKKLAAPLNAADFALQMVEGADAVEFTWSAP